jgi:hypothetical protein
MTATEPKHLISIEDFANVRPEHAAYPFQTYRLKYCLICSNGATKSALFDMGNNVIAEERYCDTHVKRIKT